MDFPQVIKKYPNNEIMRNNTKRNKAKTEARRDFWVLRSGDFLPERFSDCLPMYMGYYSESVALRELRRAGNLFDTQEDAIEASMSIRAELKRLEFIFRERQEYIQRRGIRPRNVGLSDRESHALKNLLREMEALEDEP